MEIERTFVVHGAEGWDEPTPIGSFTVFDVRPGRVDMQIREPGDYGLKTCQASDLAGGDAQQNARALEAVLNGQDHGAHRDCLLLGTSLALEVVGRTSSPQEGVEMAAAAIDSGKARQVLQSLLTFSKNAESCQRPQRRASPGEPNTMSDFLEQMAASSRERLEAARRSRSEAALLQAAEAMAPAPTLVTHRFDLIAELKLRSPAVGQLKANTEDVASRVTTYARAGAAAVSVLTEPSRFDGSMSHLEQATQALASLNVPAMRKDFLVDPYQVLEARVAGAGGVLVIIRMLSPSGIQEMLECASNVGLFVLLEAFDEADIEVMHRILSPKTTGQVLAGLNCRDLATLQIVPQRLIDLAHLLPTHVPRVAESGVVTPEDAARVAAAGYELALVGSALMQGGDPHTLAAAMLKAGRQSRPQ